MRALASRAALGYAGDDSTGFRCHRRWVQGGDGADVEVKVCYARRACYHTGGVEELKLAGYIERETHTQTERERTLVAHTQAAYPYWSRRACNLHPRCSLPAIHVCIDCGALKHIRYTQELTCLQLFQALLQRHRMRLR